MLGFYILHSAHFDGLYQESEGSCICVFGIDFASFYECSIGFWNCSETGIFCFLFYETLKF